MYSSPGARAAGIEQGSRLPAGELTAWLRRSADALEEAMTRLTEDQWQASVLTAQGQAIPASEVPWMRSREVYVHVVDLATGVSFADLPAASSLRCATMRRGTAVRPLPRPWCWRPVIRPAVGPAG